MLIYLMREKNYYSNLHHADPIQITLNSGSTVDLYSVSQIRNYIGNGDITAAADLAKCYNKMVE